MIRSEFRMTSIFRVLLLVVVGFVPLFTARSVHAQGSIGIATSITVQQMMTDLNNYGTWIPDREWGWVWQPRGVLPGWRPYAHGQWLVAEGFGMYWQSYEPFGWAVYHYGRWAWWGGNRGWVWIPDKTWGPGYVNWAYGEGYMAWTPMEPTQASAAQGIRNGSVEKAPWMWMIVPQASVLTSNVWQWALPSARNINIMKHLEQHTVFSGVSDYSIPKDMLLAISGSGDPAQVVAFVMTPLNTAQGDVRGVIEAYAPVLTGGAQPLGSQFKIAPPTPSHAPPPPSRPMPPLPPTWQAVPMSQGASQEQAAARQQQLQAIYRNGQATRLAQAQNYDAYSPPVSAWNMSNGAQWKENERGELEAQNQREQALTQGVASGNSPYAAPQVQQSYESGTK
ncbi:MAG: DUF6600 domain-containing protein [Planctomycetota bacterium]